ncbi:MAG: ABC-2 family transporter protein [Polyangiaceae bacterium]
MSTLPRYLRLFGVQLKSSLLLGMQYRADFVLDGAIEIFWALTAVVPLVVVYRIRPSIAGWGFAEALVVVGFFTLLQAVIEGAINPSLTTVVEHVRKGTLDLVLLKPADAQFLLSTARFLPWRAINAVTAAVIFAYAFHLLGRGPTAIALVTSLVLFVMACAILYALWILTVSAAFYVVRIDNLTYLFTSVFDAARWPSSIFRGFFRVVFTFVIPLALMTTYPAQALLGTLAPRVLVGSIVAAVVFGVISRRVWLHAIARYTSASS